MIKKKYGDCMRRVHTPSALRRGWLIFFIICVMSFTACPDPYPNPTNYKHRVITVTLENFRELNVPATLNFTPAYTPNNGDITYILNDGKGNRFNSESFNGVINCSSYDTSSFTTLVFTQVFYRRGEELGKQIIKTEALNGIFITIKDTNNRVLSTRSPSLTLRYIEYVPRK